MRTCTRMLIRVLFLTVVAGRVSASCWQEDAVPPAFGYTLESGPLTWAGMKANGEWNLCRLGTKQSPILVNTRSAPQVRGPSLLARYPLHLSSITHRATTDRTA